MPLKLYVGNLPWSTTSADLERDVQCSMGRSVPRK